MQFRQPLKLPTPGNKSHMCTGDFSAPIRPPTHLPAPQPVPIGREKEGKGRSFCQQVDPTVPSGTFWGQSRSQKLQQRKNQEFSRIDAGVSQRRSQCGEKPRRKVTFEVRAFLSRFQCVWVRNYRDTARFRFVADRSKSVKKTLIFYLRLFLKTHFLTQPSKEPMSM